MPRKFIPKKSDLEIYNEDIQRQLKYALGMVSRSPCRRFKLTLQFSPPQDVDVLGRPAANTKFVVIGRPRPRPIPGPGCRPGGKLRTSTVRLSLEGTL